MNYAKSIFTVGFLVPGILFVIAMGGVLYANGWVNSEYAKRSEAAGELARNTKTADKLDAELLPWKGAVAFFEKEKTTKISQELPPYVEGLCSGKFQGKVIRTSLDVKEDPDRGESSQMEFIGRYDALQQLADDIQGQYPYSIFDTLNFRSATPTTSIPTKHLTATFTLVNQPDVSSKK